MSEESSNPFLGKPISLVTKAGLRYEGKLYTVVSSLSCACPAVRKYILIRVSFSFIRLPTMLSHQ